MQCCYSNPGNHWIFSSLSALENVHILEPFIRKAIGVEIGKVKSKEGYSSLQAGLPSPLQELACHMGSHSITCHPAEVTFPPSPRPKLVLDLATPEGCKAELTQWWSGGSASVSFNTVAVRWARLVLGWVHDRSRDWVAFSPSWSMASLGLVSSGAAADGVAYFFLKNWWPF